MHCRDWEEDYKETISHALDVSERSGLSGIFDMPNTSPSVTSRDTVRLRLREANKLYSNVFYGLYIGLTSNPYQIAEAVACARDYFPKKGDRVGVVGLKMFAGKSVGDLSVTSAEGQAKVYQNLVRNGYKGVLAVHCEEESLMQTGWDPKNPITHSYARPEHSETDSIAQQIMFADQFRYSGKLHIAHVSTPLSVELVSSTRNRLNISCGVTPHHLLFDNVLMSGENGIFYKVNPPLRNPITRTHLFDYFLNGSIDVLESDHAPHTVSDKLDKHMSGIPWLASWPSVFEILREQGADESLIEKMSHDNVNHIFGTTICKIESRKKAVKEDDLDKSLGKIVEGDDRDFYCFDPLRFLRS